MFSQTYEHTRANHTHVSIHNHFLFLSVLAIGRTSPRASTTMTGSKANNDQSSASPQASVHITSNLAQNKILCYNQLSADELLTGRVSGDASEKQFPASGTPIPDLLYSSSARRSPASPPSSRLGVIWTIFAISVLVCSGYFFRDYIQRLLASVEDQNDIIVFPMLILLYVFVSMPFAWGYLIINIATGYMYGFWRGLLVTMITSIIGIAIAHLIIRRFMVKFVKK